MVVLNAQINMMAMITPTMIEPKFKTVPPFILYKVEK
jgi:hypothetical protein